MHLALIKYSVLRLALFVGSLVLLWAVGVKRSLLMVVLAAFISLALSYLLLGKQRAGAEFAITDMVFRVEDYTELVERAAEVGVTIPILPGIMPILNLRQVTRMAELSGREVPVEVRDRLTVHEDDPAALRAAGIQLAAELCDELLEGGAPGLHFYTLNRSKATREIFAALRITV